MHSAQPVLPPGRTGLPLVGETLAFLRNPFEFVAAKVAAHGPVSKTSLLGKRTAVICGPQVLGHWIDEADLRREGSAPAHIEFLFGGKNIGLIDGQEHRARKAAVLAGL